MGLDMYLEKAKIVHRDGEEICLAGMHPETLKEDDPELYAFLKPYVQMRGSIYQWESYMQEVGYWRKANHIHGWFIDNLADGNDEYIALPVTYSQLCELLEKCKIVQQNHEMAEKLLPTRDGFFFGSTEYNDYYFRDIDQTIEIIERTLASTDFITEKIYYCASW